MSRASSEDSRLSASDGERAREDRRAAEGGWGAPVYPAAGPRGVKRPRSRSPPPVAVDAPEASQHRPLPARSRRTSASAQATSPLHASGRRRSWMHRRGTSYAAMQDSESTENTVAQGPVMIVLEPAPVDFDAKEVRTGARKSGRGKEREVRGLHRRLEHGLTLSVRRLRALVVLRALKVLRTLVVDLRTLVVDLRTLVVLHIPVAPHTPSPLHSLRAHKLPQFHSIPAPIRNTASILILSPIRILHLRTLILQVSSLVPQLTPNTHLLSPKHPLVYLRTSFVYLRTPFVYLRTSFVCLRTSFVSRRRPSRRFDKLSKPREKRCRRRS
ncbi:hypothetical protein K523DRAFT_419038 [Schizophyllum commune Tattone D]|nr:hypothetical protein K523DRAFT_419038 [Schizophyllum commune Tattone D]